MSTTPFNPPKVRTQEEIAARVKALEAIMIEKGIMTTEAVDRLAEIYENEVGPRLEGRRAGVDRSGVQGPPARRRHEGVRRSGHRGPPGPTRPPNRNRQVSVATPGERNPAEES